MSVSLHLCQPGGGASCGACCGLYNFRDHSRASLSRALARQTAVVRGVPRNAEAYRAVAAQLKEERAPALFPLVRVCPLLGFLDADHTRVGCLAHPLVTGGVDLRDCGVYTAETCERFTCPSFGWLTDAQARLVRAACPDWYLYGLVITDVELVRGCLKLVEMERAAPVDPDALCARPEALEAVRALFSLKETAPGRDADMTVFGRFGPADAEGEPSLRTLDYAALGTHAAPEDDVVLCLGYAPESAQVLEEARALVRRHVQRIARALDTLPSNFPSPPGRGTG
ncbi:MAG: hypothetical protein L0Y66_01275 [Myxococcaceae bacterium]|nr:hypothetical protein [Myxococcaceae bacterium]MCI0673320.1 hypothetical protein [Myxococcaceae bacterium]